MNKSWFEIYSGTCDLSSVRECTFQIQQRPEWEFDQSEQGWDRNSQSKQSFLSSFDSGGKARQFATKNKKLPEGVHASQHKIKSSEGLTLVFFPIFFVEFIYSGFRSAWIVLGNLKYCQVGKYALQTPLRKERGVDEWNVNASKSLKTTCRISQAIF